MVKRCEWARDELMAEYHDREWGVPVHDDRKLFELLMLDGAQAGLSWATILRKRENYRRAFDSFDPVKISKYAQKDVRRLLADNGIVRNKMKILSAINNARQFLKVQEEFGSFDRYIWGFTNHKPVINSYRRLRDLPATSSVSDAMSRDLKNRGFNFVGSTICYAFMQSVGMVNDHLVYCFRRKL
jgi:DNA-3-methyladenine glycosylase I